VYQLTSVAKQYRKGRRTVPAVQDLTLTIENGEWLAVQGRTGHGKSTLLNLLGGLDRPSGGTVELDGTRLGALRETQLTRLRAHKIGFIFQTFNLIPTLTAAENVETALIPLGAGQAGRRPRVAAALDAVGLADRAGHLPTELSGGQQQRVAIARALVKDPKVLLADEPTGELDRSTAQDVFSALQTANSELGVTVLVVTHDPAVSSQVRRTIAIRDGKTSSETIRHAATDEQGTTTLHAREYATLDRAGRVQLPREMTRRLGMRNRVELQEEPDHIGVWPDQGADQERE
jgi:ABC-type lipoprotein export system ATPase subunit